MRFGVGLEVGFGMGLVVGFVMGRWVDGLIEHTDSQLESL